MLARAQADKINSNDPISEKKLKQLDGEYSTKKTILGFDFDRIEKTIWLEEAKRAHLLTGIHGWICSSKSGMTGIPFKEFETVVAKIRHAFTAIPVGRGLLIPCNNILQSKPPLVYLQRNPVLRGYFGNHQTPQRDATSSLGGGLTTSAFVMLCPMVSAASSLARTNPASQRFSDGNGLRKLRTSIRTMLSPTQI
jgi:hypothetical protein